MQRTGTPKYSSFTGTPDTWQRNNVNLKNARVDKDVRRTRFVNNVHKLKNDVQQVRQSIPAKTQQVRRNVPAPQEQQNRSNDADKRNDSNVDDNQNKQNRNAEAFQLRKSNQIVPIYRRIQNDKQATHGSNVDAIFVDNRCRYWIQQRIGDMMNANAFTTKSGYSFAVDVDKYASGLCFRFSRHGTEIARIDSNGYLYCSNAWLNGINVLSILNSIRDRVGSIGEDLTLYVKHKQLKNGTYEMDVKNINTLTLTSGSTETQDLLVTNTLTCNGTGTFTALDVANNVKNTWYETLRYDGNLNNNDYIRIVMNDASKQGFIDFTRDTQYYKLKLYVDGGLGVVSINESGIELDGVVDIHDDLTLWQKLYVNDIYSANTYVNVRSPTTFTSNVHVDGQTQLSNLTGISISTNHIHNDALTITDMALTAGHGVDIRIGCDEFRTGNSGYLCFHYVGDDDVMNYLSLGFEGYYDLYKYYRDNVTFTRKLNMNMSTANAYPIDVIEPTLSNNSAYNVKVSDGTASSVVGLNKNVNGYYTCLKNDGQQAEVNVWNDHVEITPTLTMNHNINGFCDSTDFANNINVDDAHLVTAQAARNLTFFNEYPTHVIKTTTLPYTQYWYDLAYSPTLNVWLVMPNNSRYGAYSTDNGETWNSFDCNTVSVISDVCWCDDVGQFFAVNYNSQYAMLSSTGVVYDSIYNMNMGVHLWRGCASGNGVTIAVNSDSSSIFYFQGGSRNRQITLDATYVMSHVVFGAGMFFGISEANYFALYSYDGVTWGKCGAIANNTISDLFYGTNGCFIQLSGTRQYQWWRCKTNLNQGDPGPQPFYSGGTQYLPDYGNNAWCSGAYGNGRYVVLMDGGDKIAISTDSIPSTDSWTLIDISTPISQPIIKYGNGVFIFVSRVTIANNVACVLNFKQYRTDDIIISNNIRGDNNDRLDALEKQVRGLRYAILASVYPVGSIYVNSSNGTDPAELLGFGTWVQINDRFLYCVTAGAGTTGGYSVHHHDWRLAFTLYDDTVNGAMPMDVNNGIGGLWGYNYASGQWQPGERQNYTIPGTMRMAAGTVTQTNYNWQMYTTGGTTVESNLPPYLAVYAWIRTA